MNLTAKNNHTYIQVLQDKLFQNVYIGSEPEQPRFYFAPASTLQVNGIGR